MTTTSTTWVHPMLLFVLVTGALICMAEPPSIFSNNVAFNATVSKVNKVGAYTTLQAALNAAPVLSTTKYIIHVEAGVYVERVQVPRNLTNIVLIGDGAQETLIQWNLHAPQYGTLETATLSVQGDGFIAVSMAFENTAGPGFQAVAVLTTSSRTAYYKCTFLGYQDTLYAKEGQQFYKECDIYGTVDFIFGAAAAVFQSCNLYARSHQPVVYTAQNKNGQSTDRSGFVIQDCNVTVAPGVQGTFRAYLGRPWSNYSTVVVMESYIENIVDPLGWDNSMGSMSTDWITYMEYNNRGPRAATGERVRWKGYQDATGHPDTVRRFTVGQFINLNPEWLDATGIPYTSGFMYN